MSEFKNMVIKARPADLEEMLFGSAKNFVPQFEAGGSPLTKSIGYPNPMSYASVYGTVIIRTEEVDTHTNTMGFLYIQQKDHNVAKNYKLQMDPIGYLIPDISVADLTSGLNKDCHIEPDVIARIDQLQLTRALVEATNTYTDESLGFRLMDDILQNTSAAIYILRDPATGVVNKNGQIQLYLICKMSAQELTQTAERLNKQPVCANGVKFEITQLDADDYILSGPSIN